MIIDQKSGVVEVAGEGSSRTATINSKEVAKLQYLLTEGLYKDAESATIVELTNNGVDSIIESGKDPVENPVIVELRDDGTNKSLTITDRGMGMSKEFFEEFFMNLLSSTKGESNDYIGSFGVGGKSWASLHRSVTFTIIKDGNLCKYVCWKGETMIDYDLIYEETTEEENGVIFEMPINSWSEFQTFCNKAKNKLSYYDTVVLIINGNIWDNKIYRNDLFQYSSHKPFNELHVCLKDVVYKLDYDKLGIAPIRIPVAIRLNLNEGVGVTLSREDLLYSKETIALLLDRIDQVGNYFKGKYNESLKEEFNFYEGYNKIDNNYYNVNIEGNVFECSCLLNYGNLSFNPVKIKGLTHRSASYYKSNMYTWGQIFLPKAQKVNGVWRTKHIHLNLPYRFKDASKIVLSPDHLVGNVKEYIKEKTERGSIYVGLHNPTLHWYKSNLGLRGVKKELWRSCIIEFNELIQSLIKDFCVDFRDVESTVDYKNWLENRRILRKTTKIKGSGNYKILDKEEGEVTIAYSRPSLTTADSVFEKNTYKIKDLHKTPHIVVTFTEEDKAIATELARILVKEKVAIIGKRERLKITAKQFKTYNEFMGDNKPFRRIATALLAKEAIKDFEEIYRNDIVQNCLEDLNRDKISLEAYTYANKINMDNSVKVAITELAKDQNLYDEEMMPILNRINKACKTFSFIKYMKRPEYWDHESKAEVNKLIYQMLLFQKKYYKELDNYELTLKP